MRASRYIPLSLSSDPIRLDGPLCFANGQWNVPFYVNNPWPVFALIQDYDVGEPEEQPDGTKTITMEMANGRAVYQVDQKDEWGSYECRLLPGSTYQPREQS